MAEKAGRRCNIIAIPYPGRGHINPMINFCKLLASRRPTDLAITFIVTEEWHSLLSSGDSLPENIRLGTIPNVLPLEAIRWRVFPAFIEALFTKMEPAVESFLDRVGGPDPSLIISDTYLGWALKIGKRRNIPVASFWTISAAMLSICHHFDLIVQNGHYLVDPSERGEEMVDYVPGVAPISVADLPPPFHGIRSETLTKTVDLVKSASSEARYFLIPSYYDLEASAIDNLKSTFPIPIYCIGPAIPHLNTTIRNNAGDYLKWLDSQPESSVLYISLGTFVSITDEQVREISAGVADSGVRFFWVLRGDHASIGEGSSRGLVVPWCDQIGVLRHPAIGGFWSHCGWNSSKEGALAGVPMLTFPLIWDQFPNSKQVVEDWKIGRRLKRGGGGLVGRDEISRVLKMFMDLDLEEGKEMRTRAANVGEICCKAIGDADLQIEAFLEEITR